MKTYSELGDAATSLLDRDEVEGVLSGAFYAPPVIDIPRPRASSRGRSPAKPPPSHYKVICISMYNEDLQHVDAMIDALKERGVTKANRSALIRYALSQVDLDKVPRGM